MHVVKIGDGSDKQGNKRMKLKFGSGLPSLVNVSQTTAVIKT